MAFVLAAGSTQGHEDASHSPPSRPHSLPFVDDMKDRPKLEVLLDKEEIYLKGTGVDVEPALLSGRVALYLAESTSIKEITLQFRGKAHLSSYDSMNVNSSSLTYVICNHEWSFLEGEKRHSHTLKAGRHFFPFQLQLGGSLPSSISTLAMGGASVMYKLKAHATRPGFNHNLQATVPVHIVRSLSAEALEYQQTLEIENTWPEKVMYSITLPHKAWAAGDTLTAIMKFSPLAKGVCVLSVASSIHETTKLFGRSTHQEHTRIVASTKHELFGGRAVQVDPRRPTRSGSNTPADLAQGSNPSLSSLESTSQPSRPETSESEDDDVTTFISLDIPLKITPTHALDPIIVSHRIKWTILILNLDGHTSELRCSLPLCLLDHCLLDESRSFSAQTRRLLLGGPEVPPTAEEEDMELPSYNAHLRDRVANMYMPESATMRVTNPWVHSSVSPVLSDRRDAMHPWPLTSSGTSTPLEAHVVSHLPHAPGSGDSTPLDWVNSELLLSLSGDTPPSLSVASRISPEHSDPSSHNNSQDNSLRQSRRSSRASSPERGHHLHSPHETYIHSASHASRNLHSLFKASLKPLSSLSHPLRLTSRSHSHNSIPTMSSLSQSHIGPATSGSSLHIPDPHSGLSLLHRAFTEVPDYQIASRGFIGGVTPLTSMAGLPSYAEASTSTEPGPRPSSAPVPSPLILSS